MGPLQLTYEYWLSTQYEAVLIAMRTAVEASSAAVRVILVAVAPIVIALTAYSWGKGHITWTKAMGDVTRLLVIGALLGGQALYTSRVAPFVFETVPNEIASTISGARSRAASYRQFDTNRIALENLSADIRRKNTEWSLNALGNAANNLASTGAGHWWLTVMAAVWLASIRCLAIALAIIPWLMLFEFWERTRAFFQHWIGVVVGLITFQIACGYFLQVSMQSQMTVLRSVRDASQGSNSIDLMVQNLMHAANGIFADALTMLVLPSMCGLAGGVGAHFAGQAVTKLPGMMARTYNSYRTARA